MVGLEAYRPIGLGCIVLHRGHKPVGPGEVDHWFSNEKATRWFWPLEERRYLSRKGATWTLWEMKGKWRGQGWTCIGLSLFVFWCSLRTCIYNTNLHTVAPQQKGQHRSHLIFSTVQLVHLPWHPQSPVVHVSPSGSQSSSVRPLSSGLAQQFLINDK